MLNRVLIGTGVTGLTIGSGVGIYQYLNQPKSTKETKVFLSTRLINEGYELLTLEEGNKDFAEVLKKYKLAKKNIFGTPEAAAQAEASTLIEKCQNAISSEPNDDSNYKLARKWCVKEKSVSDILGDNYTLLNTTQEQPGEAEIWAEKVKELKKSTDSRFQELKEKLKNPSSDVATLKTECQNLKPTEIKTTSDEFEDVLDKTREFCSQKKER